MSRKDSVTARGPLVNKLKEGLQEAVVFLRTLGDFKIPAVIERRRKELLQKLSLLQGDTIKEVPPVIEPKELQPSLPSKESPPPPPAAKGREETPPSAASSDVASPSHGQGKITRSDSTVVSSRIKDYEKIHFSAKKEEEGETPKHWAVQLKKVAKPTDFPGNSALPSHSASSTPGDNAAEETKDAKEEGKEQDMLEVDQGRERAPSVSSMDDGGEGEEEEAEEDGKKKKKKKSKLPFGLKVKTGGRKRDKSPGPDKKFEESVENLADGEDSEPVMEEGVKIFGILEKRHKKGLGGHKWVKLAAKVQHTTLVLGGKDDLELANCSVEATDSGFELMHPQHRSGVVFRLEGGEEERQKWVEVLKEAIQEATPQEEEAPSEEVTESTQSTQPLDDIPSITVDEVTSSISSNKNKRESKSLTVKPDKRLPDQGVAMKGYIHRKKPGLTRSWEKCYCVLTYQAMYFTTVEDKKDYTSMLPLSADCDGKLSETKKGKGHDKHIQVPGLVLKLGRKMEQFSFETQTEFRDWKDSIERVLGIGGVEELLSEDEEPEIAEDLYEELEPDFVPPIPDSPRPSHCPSRPNIPTVPESDDILIDEDIYEDTDDLLPTLPSIHSPQHAPAPSLPDRNPPKRASSPPPSLPPRSAAAAPLPNLPPRNTKPTSSAQEYERTVAKKPAAKPPIPTEDDEELYDDVVTSPTEIEETYDDVVVTESGIIEEDLYDDVVPTTTGLDSKTEPIQDEYYEDMAPGAPAAQNYVTMEKNGDPQDEGEELYVDVDEPVSRSPVPKKPDTQKQANSKGTFSRMFNKRGSEQKVSLTGMLGYKAPKKSKFEDKWAVIDSSNLLIYKTSSDKKSQEKIALSECRLELGSTEAGAGKFAFHLSKGEKVYHFSLKEATNLEEWVGVVKGLVKYAPVEAKGGVIPEDEDIYQAKEDHIAEGDGELTFKKGTYIRLISRESPVLWVGQIGTEDQVFEGKIGQFPAGKVQIAEDLYI